MAAASSDDHGCDAEYSINLTHISNYNAMHKFKSFSLTREELRLDSTQSHWLRSTVMGWFYELGVLELPNADLAVDDVLLGLQELMKAATQDDSSLVLNVEIVSGLREDPTDESGDPGEEPMNPDEALDEEDGLSDYESIYPDEAFDEEVVRLQEYELEHQKDAALDEEPMNSHEDFGGDEAPNEEAAVYITYETIFSYEAVYGSEYSRDEHREDGPEYNPMYTDSEDGSEYDSMYTDAEEDDSMYTDEEEDNSMYTDEDTDEEDEEEDEEVAKARFQWVKEVLIVGEVCIQKASQARVPLQGSCCSICLEEFEGNLEESVVILLCSHVLHEGCLIPWILKGKPTCPLCRCGVLDPSRLP